MASLWEAADAGTRAGIYGQAVADQAASTRNAQNLGVLKDTLEQMSGVAQQIAKIKGPDAAMRAVSGPLQTAARFVGVLRAQGIPIPEDLAQQVVSAAVQVPTSEETATAAGQAEYQKGAVVAQNLMAAGAPSGAAMGAGFGAPYNTGRELDRPKPVVGGAFGINQDTGATAYRNPEVLEAQRSIAAAGAAKGTQVQVDTGTSHKAMIESIVPDMIKQINAEKDNINQAYGMANIVSQLEQLYASGDVGGPGTSARKSVINLATALGVNVGKLGVDEGSTPTAEAVSALTSELTLKMKNKFQLGSQGFTDKDLDFVYNMTDTLNKTPEGRKLMLEMWRAEAAAQVKRSKVANALLQDNYQMLKTGDLGNLHSAIEIAEAQNTASQGMFSGLAEKAKALNEEYQKRRGTAPAETTAAAGGAPQTPAGTPPEDLAKKYGFTLNP